MAARRKARKAPAKRKAKAKAKPRKRPAKVTKVVAKPGPKPRARGRDKTDDSPRERRLAAFLVHLASLRHVGKACERAGIKSRGTVYVRYQNNREFREKWDAALAGQVDEVRQTLVEGALYGTVEQTFERARNGRMVLTKEVHRPPSSADARWLLERLKAAQFSSRVTAAEALKTLGYDPNAAASSGVLVVPGAMSVDEWIEAQEAKNAEREPPKE